MNRSPRFPSFLIILLALLLLVSGTYLGVQALSQTFSYASTLPTWLSAQNSGSGVESVLQDSATTPSSSSQLTAQDSSLGDSSSGEPIVDVALTVSDASAISETISNAISTTISATITTAISETVVITGQSITSQSITETDTFTDSVGLPADAPAPAPQTTLTISGVLPLGLEAALAQHFIVVPITQTAATNPADLVVNFEAAGAAAAYEQIFAVATRFDALDLDVTWDELGLLWRGAPEDLDPDTAILAYDQIFVPRQMIAGVELILGAAGSTVRELADDDIAVEVAWDKPDALVIVPFDELVPRLAVVAIDGQRPIENANRFDAVAYPLSVPIYLHNQTDSAEVGEILGQLPSSNRQADRLTVLAMTGVTALTRYTALQMDKLGIAWPAEVVGPELASADITHISNEVPFLRDCETNTAADNLLFCSKLEYFATLQASGVDLIGLTGNHQNDYGREAARESLDFYERAGLPVFGGGANKAAAMAPLYYEHNGNRLAFLGANSYGPPFAWATDTEPGSAEFDLNIMSATIRNIHALDRADVVLVDLQYQETYDVNPLIEQRVDFNALVRAGADIVTGVQSHVPQAVEFTDGNLILYGLGNLFFDQMQARETREGMIVKHTIYEGRHISTQILPTLLYDSGQPRWMSAEERAQLLTRVFNVSYWE